MPGMFGRPLKGVDGCVETRTQHLNSVHHCLVCPGSVGQPRGGKVGTQFAVYDRESTTLVFHHLIYDIEGTARDMQVQGFPEALNSRLRAGVC